MDEKLKPCPFCGGDNIVTLTPTCTAATPYDPSDRLYPVVRCMDCSAEVSGDNGDRTGRTAEEKWNRRPGEDTARAAGYAAGIADAAERERALTKLLAEIRKWMDADVCGPWDAKFIADIDRALSTSEKGEVTNG